MPEPSPNNVNPIRDKHNAINKNVKKDNAKGFPLQPESFFLEVPNLDLAPSPCLEHLHQNCMVTFEGVDALGHLVAIKVFGDTKPRAAFAKALAHGRDVLPSRGKLQGRHFGALGSK